MLATRRAALERSGSLQVLADRLRRLVEPVLEGSIYLPVHKALLSRDGGVCERDGTRLAFDPLEPHRHSCPRCGRVHTGERHHRAWIWRYHLWLSERAIHLALLAGLRGDQHLADRARQVLGAYATRYRKFPNRDNVLGPTRLFFSTYLESIWLIQLVIAGLLLRDAVAPASPGDHWEGFDGVVRESARLIGSFDEGRSNRQVWNSTALLAAGLWLEEDELVGRGLDGPHGVRTLMVACVGEEGMWFEGENYHFFALRGLMLAAELARQLGVDLYGGDAPAGRMRDMFAAPLLTVLPDLTLPARGDAPYGVTLRQARFAELWEIAWVRTGEVEFESVLSQLYGSPGGEDEDHGLSEIAEQEQNYPPQRMERERLGWKALLWMSPATPSADPDLWRTRSVLLPEAGLAVVRPGPRRYVSLECGGRPGGHGHPDALHVSLFWDEPLLMDFGTASYVSPSLHWYRSTLAHNAPGVSGIGQLSRTAWCRAFDSQGAFSWCRAVAADVLGTGSEVTRTLVVGPSYVLDVVDIAADARTSVDLPIHLVDPESPRWRALGGDDAGVEFESVAELRSASGGVIRLAPRDGESLSIVERPGPPDHRFADGASLAFLVRRARGPGRWIQVYGRGSDVPAHIGVERASVVLQFSDGMADRVTLGRRCEIRDRTGKLVVLDGRRAKPRRGVRGVPTPPTRRCPLLPHAPTLDDRETTIPQWAWSELGAGAYRRSEDDYGARGPFRAAVAVFATPSSVGFMADVTKSDCTFRHHSAEDPRLDNEHPDIHSDGVQCYVDLDGWAGYLVVPDQGSSVRVRVVQGTAGNPSRVSGVWQRTVAGYRIMVQVSAHQTLQPGDRVPVNMVVNEMYPDRERRAGQLVLAGGGGWVYLRGDREHPASAVIAEVR